MVDVPLDLDRVAQAATAIPGVFLRTPQYRSEALSRLLGIEVILKVETVNPCGTVASRGAEWWFECHADVHRVVCANAGDFGAAMAHAGRRRGIEVELFGPIDADSAKVDALRHAGTMVRLDARDSEEARADARRYSALVDGSFIEDGDHIELAEGAATMAAELATLSGDIDAVFVPIGLGSLAHGTVVWCHEHMPRTRIVGVGAERAVNALSDSLDDTELVSDRHLAQAAAALMAHEGIRASMDGGAALAAAARAAPDMPGARVVVPVTGRVVG